MKGGVKRLFDVSVALVTLILSCPAFVIIAIVIRFTSPGPVIFSQTRLGRSERPSQCLKFRTMQVETPNVATHEVGRSWLTPVGGLLRRSKLDELPQLNNVLRGDMSLVGPRPCLPQQEELIRGRRERVVFDVRPGITGMAQLAHIDMSTPGPLAAAGARYIEQQSFKLDVMILINTVLGRGLGDVA